MFTLSDTENETDTEKDYGFHCNVQNTSHCTETLALMPWVTFSLFVGIGLGVVHCEHTITHTIRDTVFVSGTFDLLNIMRKQCNRTALKPFLNGIKISDVDGRCKRSRPRLLYIYWQTDGSFTCTVWVNVFVISNTFDLCNVEWNPFFKP